MAQPKQGFAHPYFPHLDPERRWLFRLEFTLGAVEVGDILSFNAQSVTLPSVTFDPIVIPHMNQDVKVAGRPTLGEMTVVFLTAYNLDAINVLERWHRLIYTPSTEEMGFADTYKADGQLIILKPDLEEYKIYTFKGAWPMTIGDKEYDWSASENVTRSVTFAVDKVLDPEDGNTSGTAPGAS